MKIEEIETPWHSPPRELFHDLRAEDEEALARRERAHEEVMRRLERVDSSGRARRDDDDDDDGDEGRGRDDGGRGKRGGDDEGGVSRPGARGTRISRTTRRRW